MSDKEIQLDVSSILKESYIEDPQILKPFFSGYFPMKDTFFLIFITVLDALFITFAIALIMFFHSQEIPNEENISNNTITIFGIPITKLNLYYLRLSSLGLLLISGLISIFFLIKTKNNVYNFWIKLYSLFRMLFLMGIITVLFYFFYVDENEKITKLEDSKNTPNFILIILLFNLTILPVLVLFSQWSFFYVSISLGSSKE